MIRIENEFGRFYADSEQDYDQGNFYVSVTTVLDSLVDSDLKDFFINNTAEAIAAIRKSTAKAGTDLHKLVEDDLNGKDPVPTEKQAKAWDVWSTMRHTHNIEATHTEVQVFHQDLGFAGTADVIGNFESCSSRKCCFYNVSGPAVMDLKTGRSYKVQAGWQIAAYREAAISMGLADKDCGGVGLHVVRDGSEGRPFTMKHLDPCFETFLHAMQAWKFLNFNKLAKMKWKYLKEDALKKHWGV